MRFYVLSECFMLIKENMWAEGSPQALVLLLGVDRRVRAAWMFKSHLASGGTPADA